MKKIYTKNAPEPIGPYSQGWEKDGWYFFSGQIATSPEGKFYNKNIKEEVKQIFKNIQSLLDEAELRKENIIKTTVFLADMNDFLEFNEIYGEFMGEHHPARSTVEVSRLPKDARVEIECIAVK